MTTTFALAVHGGAGTIRRSALTPELEAATHAGLRRALDAGTAVLRDGGAALDAVTAAVCALEDEPLFNAGRGAVFTSAGRQEMDAAVMNGADRRAGAVAGLFGPRNPVLAARAVMERSPHVVMIGAGAERIAREAGLAFEEASYFFTEKRWDALQEMLALARKGETSADPAVRHGTVGAVACDRNGNLAAATSTGGMTGKAPGRVGDTPVIGAGTLADDLCAISGTGHGEVFIRFQAAAEISARMRYLGESLEAASEHVVQRVLAPNDGSGGLIAVDRHGRVALPFNSEGMYRGFVQGDAEPVTAIY
ncbi:isoaspartyl peptidase/L-asparaginase family protein [Aureimonas jatrophae]|uniref:Isoaspartyl peptidase n=1 Tax=Aureimonas jatrophae TaxID=1166073 RepID=A0A1H0HHD8_9HYPH|nr:isoaspartyl peptidase/L-asparaginase [Aureimonas jatrophae]MBB3950591.1 beta-aspartyl-peptidase (threonine type) [Aureimonas jatrophae]SDO18527.1 beta-aspartyl-peptidase (threonine type) [Aureimonas jatrophae]